MTSSDSARGRQMVLLAMVVLVAPVLAGCANTEPTPGEGETDDHEHGADHGHDTGAGHDHGDAHGHDHAHDDGHDHMDGHDHGADHGHDTGAGHGHDDAHGHDHGHDDGHGHGDAPGYERGKPTRPAPMGTAPDAAQIAALVAAFDDMPFTGGQSTPGHVFKFVSEDTFIFLHFKEAEPADFQNLLYVGTGVRGVACSEAQPDAEMGAFTHFHKYDSETWEGGHGGAAGAEGYWFTHIAVDTFDMPWGTVTPGVDYGFMPTPAEDCGDSVPAPTFAPDDADGLDANETRALVEAFTSEPFVGGQETPSHVFRWVNEEVFIFLHFDTPDPLASTQLLYYGPGIRGEACEDAQPHGDFTHFHKWSTPTWEGGHGGAGGAFGYWFLHNAANSFTMPWGEVMPGPDRSFMPTPVDECPEDRPAGLERASPDTYPMAGWRPTAEEAAALVAAFDDMPFTGGQSTPGHVFKFVSEDSFIFLHFAEEDPADFRNLLYVGTGVKGYACSNMQPDTDMGAFTHFHKWTSPTWEAGHGGPAGTPGYWFTHIAVDTFDMPWGTVTPGVDYDFMPTPAEACDDALPLVEFSPEGADGLDADEIATLVAAFGDQPYHGGQDTPSHVFKAVNKEVWIYLHFKEAASEDFANLLYYGPLVRGEACEDAQPHGDFTHFHKWTSPTWEGGHGGAAGAFGYWFIHNAVTNFEMPWGSVVPGPDRNFMPTPVEAC